MSYSEWALARVVLKADKDKEPRPLQDPGYVGSGVDLALCVFCGKGLPALVDRLRRHHAGRPEGVTTAPAGVTFCPGPLQKEDEEAEAFAARKAQFLAARAGARAKMAELKEAADAKAQQTALDKATAPQTFVPGGAKKRPLKQAKMTDSSESHASATEALARGVYSAGLAPNVLDNKLFRRGLMAVAEAGAGWQPPSAKELLGGLLDRELVRVRSAIDAARATTARVGVTLVGDGATNVKRQPILNLSVQANRVEFIKAQNCAGMVKSNRFIADDMIATIKGLPDPKAVVLVLMDGATKGAWPLIEEACPWVVAGYCGPHVVDLLMEDVGKLPFFEALFAKSQKLRVFVKGHMHVLSAFDLVKKRAIIIPAGTRFGTNVLGLNNLTVNREALVSTFGAPAVLDAMAKVKNDKLEGEHGTLGSLFTHLQQLVMSGDFWTEAAWAAAVMKPMMKLLRFMEQDAPTSSKVYQAWFQVQEAIEALEGMPADLKADIIKAIGYRWDCGYNIVHGAGYVLDPQFRLCTPPQECTDSFNAFVLKCYPAPLRREFDDEDAYQAAKNAHLDTLATIDRQLLDFRRGNGVWSREVVLHNAKLVSAVDLWDMYGEMPLQLVALRACGCVSGACAAERGHKEMGFIQTKLRNRLRWDKTEALMYVRMNLNIIHRAVDYTNITNVSFELEDDEEPELPCAWREAAEEAEAAPLPAALERTRRRVATLTANKAAVAQAAPLPAPAAERGDGRRAVKRPRALEDFE
jgi:hypothetical protein